MTRSGSDLLSTPPPRVPEPEPGDRPARRRRRKAANHCPVCGVALSPGAKYCRHHAPRLGGLGISHGQESEYTSKLYIGRLGARRRGLAPTSICPDWGSLLCRDCTYTFPPNCPVLAGRPQAWCGTCQVACRCNGGESSP